MIASPGMQPLRLPELPGRIEPDTVVPERTIGRTLCEYGLVIVIIGALAALLQPFR